MSTPMKYEDYKNFAYTIEKDCIEKSKLLITLFNDEAKIAANQGLDHFAWYIPQLNKCSRFKSYRDKFDDAIKLIEQNKYRVDKTNKANDILFVEVVL